MHANLLKALIERNVIRARTEIDADYRGVDLAGDLLVRATGTFMILSVQETDTGHVFDCASTIDGRRQRIPGSAIVRIDGMCPTRLGLNFDLSAEGVPLVVGKRRGRKPKNRQNAPVAAVAV